MSSMVNKWIKPYLLALIGPEERLPLPGRVQVIEADDATRFLVVSDKEHKIRAFLTDQCMKRFKK